MRLFEFCLAAWTVCWKANLHFKQSRLHYSCGGVTVCGLQECGVFLLSRQGCEFKASLYEDGSLRGASGAKFQQPQQWVNSCWATLGHQKKIKKTQAYKMVRWKLQSPSWCNTHAFIKPCRYCTRRCLCFITVKSTAWNKVFRIHDVVQND